MGKVVAGLYISLDGVIESGWTGKSPAISPTDPLTSPYFNDPEVQQAVRFGLFHTLQAGARGYLLKGMDSDELMKAIRAVHAGKSRIPAFVAERLAGRMGAALRGAQSAAAPGTRYQSAGCRFACGRPA